MPSSESSKSESDNKRITPAMRQFHKFKEQHPECVLFFRMGDFYELFYDDAKKAHKVLGVTLTERTKGVPMAGVPYHAVDGYLRRMIQAGYRVAVCDQIEDPKQASAAGKKVVDRDVTRLVTPGTLTDDSLLEEGKENTLAAITFLKNEQAAIGWVELSTGFFQVANLDKKDCSDELSRIAPSELLYAQDDSAKLPKEIEQIKNTINCSLTQRPAWQFRQSEAIDILKRQYQVANLLGFGFEDDDPALVSAGAIVHYLLETQYSSEIDNPNGKEDDGLNNNAKNKSRLAHLRPPHKFERTNNLIIDQTSLRSLEVEKTIRSESVDGSLLSSLQNCVTAMGKRKLRNWLCYPLANLADIQRRQDVVQALFDDDTFRDNLRAILDDIQDIHRIAARLAIYRISPRDLVALGNSINQITNLCELLDNRNQIKEYFSKANSLKEFLYPLANHLKKACKDAAPNHLREGGLIADGYDSALDEARLLESDSNSWLANYQKELINETSIQNLKIGFNKVFGYYIEVSKANSEKAPAHWARKQTLKNGERYITEQLKEFEGKVLSAQTRAITREQELFEQLCDKARVLLEPLHEFGELVSSLDVLSCFALNASKQRQVRPEIVDKPILQITGGRHPVLSQRLGDKFVPNDISLGDADSNPTLAMITGPNMAGKSTYIRQAALLTLLAHTGSFVPADSAVIGLCDRIFTRIGASDELHTGQSTFMVEMTETANICHHVTEKSLVILDEIGRGTSTLDGLSLAWSIAEYLAVTKPRTFFATHYHELTSLSDKFKNIINLNVAVREWQEQVVFLHKIVPGGADKSYGIHVAKIAGLPQPIVKRAQQLLNELEVEHSSFDTADKKPEINHKKAQMGLFT